MKIELITEGVSFEADLRIIPERVGGLIHCDRCGFSVGMGTTATMSQDSLERGVSYFPPNCPCCGGRTKRKYARRTGDTYAVVTYEDAGEKKYFVGRAQLKKGDIYNKQLGGELASYRALGELLRYLPQSEKFKRMIGMSSHDFLRGLINSK